jgi:putative cardiolipin synthase
MMSLWRTSYRRFVFAAVLVSLASGCASLPPGVDFPKSRSSALERPEETGLGRSIEGAARQHAGLSGFRLLPSGVDGILARIQMADAAERTLDVQYYIYREDDTSRLLSDAIMRAADRHVRVRVLLDDHGAIHKNLIAGLSGHPGIEVRVFNPFTYRGESRALRFVELAFHAPRLRYRMHNKLFVADNAVALVGGRNVGDEYFQANPEFDFGDYDVFAAGPVVRELSKTFDEYWRSAMAIPVEAFAHGRANTHALDEFRKALEKHRRWMDGTDYMRRLATGEPLAGMISGRGLAWARAEVVSDSPDKATAKGHEALNWLNHGALARAAAATRSELLLVSPYLLPGDEGMRFLLDLRRRNVRIRVLTNSLEATDVAAAHAGYARYRPTLLEHGIELYEVRARMNESGGSGAPLAPASSGRFSLHAKALVFDRQKVFIGSMNFDRRSLLMNTELGLMIHSPELARQVARQFEAIAEPENSYQVVRDHNGDNGFGPPHLLWRTEKDGKVVELDVEPTRSAWQRLTVDFLLALPVDVLLGESDYRY